MSHKIERFWKKFLLLQWANAAEVERGEKRERPGLNGSAGAGCTRTGGPPAHCRPKHRILRITAVWRVRESAE